MHHPNDEKLLLLAHKELRAVGTILVNLHILLCPTCRRKYQHYQQLSLLIANEMRSEQQAPWKLPPSTGIRLQMLTITLMVLIAILLWRRQAPPLFHASAAAVMRQSSEHCK